MSVHALELETLAEAFTTSSRRDVLVEGCPDPERIWQAGCGRLTPVELKTTADHAAVCAPCAQELRAARRVAEEIGELVAFPRTDRAPVREADQPTSRPARPARALRDSTTSKRGSWPWRSTSARWAAAGLAAAAVAVLMLRPPAPTPWPEPGQMRIDSGAPAVHLLVADGQALSRTNFVLRWQGLDGARYDLRMMTEGLSEVVLLQDLSEPEATLGAEHFVDLERGTVLLWQVEAFLRDGGRVPSRTHRVLLE